MVRVLTLIEWLRLLRLKLGLARWSRGMERDLVGVQHAAVRDWVAEGALYLLAMLDDAARRALRRHVPVSCIR